MLNMLHKGKLTACESEGERIHRQLEVLLSQC